jgi:hypothetical protein
LGGALRLVSLTGFISAGGILRRRNLADRSKCLECKSNEHGPLNLEDLTLTAPQIHARMGELLYLSTGNSTGLTVGKTLAESVRRFCRSTELCEGYLRGYYGLKLVTTEFHTHRKTASTWHRH